MLIKYVHKSSMIVLAVLGMLTLSLNGCAFYSESFRAVETHILLDQMDQALSAHESINYGRKDKILYLLNHAMLLRMNKDYKGSNAAFEKAKVLIERLSAFSISEQTGAFFINDSTRSYIGEPFEQVLIHLYSALNYIAMGDLDAARVEALQVDLKLKQLTEDVDNVIYGEDAFARYLTGIIYEDKNEMNDAMIAYRKAYEGYKRHQDHFAIDIPESLKYDLLRLTKALGFNEEHQRFKKEFSIQTFTPQRKYRKKGELVIFFHNGLAPIKRESSQLLPYLPTGQIFRISVPYYEKRISAIKGAAISVGGNTANFSMVENINGIALKTLDAHLPAITARMLARVAIKTTVSHQIQKEKDWLGVIANIASVITENADTRSWLTLPGEIHMLKKAMPPGNYDIELMLLDENSDIISSKWFKNIQLIAGEKTYLSHYWTSARTGESVP